MATHYYHLSDGDWAIIEYDTHLSLFENRQTGERRMMTTAIILEYPWHTECEM
jgi:hypothetical protein